MRTHRNPPKLTLTQLYPSATQRYALRAVAYRLLTNEANDEAAITAMTTAGTNPDGARLIVMQVRSAMRTAVLDAGKRKAQVTA